ncbi:MAG: hypothetical protein K2X39_03630 [Silvanigrellaceae bacterium]|nr:hypothetical protein [Silvanigrellaceae bacterium]
MALIRQNSKSKEKLKIEISPEVISEIEAYCAWAQIDDVSYFFEEAAHLVFSKDKEWKKKKSD